jgi:hypothetical protein
MDTERVSSEMQVVNPPMAIEASEDPQELVDQEPEQEPEPPETQEVIAASEEPQEPEEDYGVNEWDKPKLDMLGNKIEAEMICIKKKVYIVGKWLYEAKDMLAHGQFMKWVEKRFRGDLAYSTAWLYAAIYKSLEDHKDLIEVYPLTVLADVRNYPLEVMVVIKEHREEYKAVHKQVMGQYKAWKRGKIDLPEFVKDTQSILDSASVRPIYDVWEEKAKPRIKNNQQIYKKHLVEQVKNQIATLIKTIGELKTLLTADEQAEATGSLADDMDLLVHNAITIKELFEQNEYLVAILDQMKRLPADQKKVRRSKHVKLHLSRNL